MADKTKPLKASALYKTPAEMQKKIDQYFEERISQERPPTISGLALFLGFADRQSIYDYKEKDQFACTIKKAVTRIEDFCEEQLITGRGGSGAIFWAKNHGWSDKQEVQHSSDPEKPVMVSLGEILANSTKS